MKLTKRLSGQLNFRPEEQVFLWLMKSPNLQFLIFDVTLTVHSTYMKLLTQPQFIITRFLWIEDSVSSLVLAKNIELGGVSFAIFSIKQQRVSLNIKWIEDQSSSCPISGLQSSAVKSLQLGNLNQLCILLTCPIPLSTSDSNHSLVLQVVRAEQAHF